MGKRDRARPRNRGRADLRRAGRGGRLEQQQLAAGIDLAVAEHAAVGGQGAACMSGSHSSTSRGIDGAVGCSSK